MAAYFAGVVQAPIPAFVIVMDMTDNHDMVVPLMLANAVSRLIKLEPLYKALAQPLERPIASFGTFARRTHQAAPVTIR